MAKPSYEDSDILPPERPVPERTAGAVGRAYRLVKRRYRAAERRVLSKIIFWERPRNMGKPMRISASTWKALTAPVKEGRAESQAARFKTRHSTELAQPFASGSVPFRQAARADLLKLGYRFVQFGDIVARGLDRASRGLLWTQGIPEGRHDIDIRRRRAALRAMTAGPRSMWWQRNPKKVITLDGPQADTVREMAVALRFSYRRQFLMNQNRGQSQTRQRNARRFPRGFLRWLPVTVATGAALGEVAFSGLMDALQTLAPRIFELIAAAPGAEAIVVAGTAVGAAVDRGVRAVRDSRRPQQLEAVVEHDQRVLDREIESYREIGELTAQLTRAGRDTTWIRRRFELIRLRDRSLEVAEVFRRLGLKESARRRASDAVIQGQVVREERALPSGEMSRAEALSRYIMDASEHQDTLTLRAAVALAQRDDAPDVRAAGSVAALLLDDRDAMTELLVRDSTSGEVDARAPALEFFLHATDTDVEREPQSNPIWSWAPTVERHERAVEIEPNDRIAEATTSAVAARLSPPEERVAAERVLVVSLTDEPHAIAPPQTAALAGGLLRHDPVLRENVVSSMAARREKLSGPDRRTYDERTQLFERTIEGGHDGGPDSTGDRGPGDLGTGPRNPPPDRRDPDAGHGAARSPSYRPRVSRVSQVRPASEREERDGPDRREPTARRVPPIPEDGRAGASRRGHRHREPRASAVPVEDRGARDRPGSSGRDLDRDITPPAR